MSTIFIGMGATIPLKPASDNLHLFQKIAQKCGQPAGVGFRFKCQVSFVSFAKINRRILNHHSLFILLTQEVKINILTIQPKLSSPYNPGKYFWSPQWKLVSGSSTFDWKWSSKFFSYPTG